MSSYLLLAPRSPTQPPPIGGAHVNTLKKRWEFQRAYRRGRKVWDGSYVVYVLPTPAGTERTGGASRYGLTASRKIGDAVRRNRAKRLIREALRSCAGRLRPGLDVVVVARSRAPYISYADACQSLTALLSRAEVLSNGAAIVAGEPTAPRAARATRDGAR